MTLTLCSHFLARFLVAGTLLISACADAQSIFAAQMADEVRDRAMGLEGLERSTNGVRGAGQFMGSTDVTSLGYEPDTSFLELGWSGQRLWNGPGADLKVYENAFQVSASDRYFMDLLIVEVSADGDLFEAFPHDYLAGDETQYEPLPNLWPGFAGRTPVLLHAEDHPIDPFSEEAGGDSFNFDDLPEGPVRDAILAGGALSVRLTAAAVEQNPDTGVAYPRAPESDGPDIDGVAGRYFTPPAN